MKKVALLAFSLVFSASAAMAQSEKCFHFEGDGFTDEIRLTVSGTSVKGQLAVSRIDSEAPSRIHNFTGTISKGVIIMRFSGTTPTAFAQSGNRMTATLTSKQLVVKVSSGGRQVYTATFVPC
jgi:hypothetical protein